MTVLHHEDQSLRALYSCLHEEAQDDVSRARVRRRVLEALAAPTPAQVPAWRWRLAVPAAAAVVLAFVAAVAYRSGTGTDPVLRIQANGGVHLEWTDVGKSSYSLVKSTSPADLSAARRVAVRGTAYIDREPEEAVVIYYRVE